MDAVTVILLIAAIVCFAVATLLPAATIDGRRPIARISFLALGLLLLAIDALLSVLGGR
jgi:hypothetical protein